TGMHLQAICVMRGRTHVVVKPVARRAEEIHAGHAPKAHMIERVARKQRRLDVDDRLFARPDGEAIGAAHALRIEKAVNDDLLAQRVRTLDPEGTEGREFLAARLCRAQDQAACRDTSDLALRQTAKKGRALEARDLAHILGAAVAEDDLEARKIE